MLRARCMLPCPLVVCVVPSQYAAMFVPHPVQHLVTPIPILVQVKDGESLLVMGPSGVGKTSVLRAIAGLWSSGSGTITRLMRSLLMLSSSALWFYMSGLLSIKPALVYANHDLHVCTNRAPRSNHKKLTAAWTKA